jgi:hypothetical protein
MLWTDLTPQCLEYTHVCWIQQYSHFLAGSIELVLWKIAGKLESLLEAVDRALKCGNPVLCKPSDTEKVGPTHQ